jgi:hypothetical protein
MVSDSKLKKLQQGKVVQLANHEIAGIGIDIERLDVPTQKKLAKAFHSGKGIRLQLNEREIHGTGLFGRKFDKLLKKGGVKKLVYKVGDAVKPAVNELLDQGITALASNPSTMALAPIAMIGKDYINDPNKYQGVKGKGIFGKRADRLMKKAGVKKALYKIGDRIKPVVQDEIRRVAHRMADGNEHMMAYADLASDIANSYIDNPKEYGMGFAGKGFAKGRGFAKGSGFSGVGVSSKSMTNLTMSNPLRPDLVNPGLPQRPMAPRANY